MTETEKERAAVDHPWSFIAEELLTRGWSIDDLAIRMAIPNYDEAISESAKWKLTLDMYRIVGPKKANCHLGEETARALGVAFGVSPEYFLNLENLWRAEHLKEGR